MEVVIAPKIGLRQSLSCYFKRLQKHIEKAGRFLCNKPYVVMTVLIVFVGVFGYALPSLADDLLASILEIINPLSALATFICTILYLINQLLLWLNMVLMHILINVVQFNQFVGARPVELGWPLVRDVVNMFFIVVLLLIAFSTIIGYEPFHYKKHLPKLLLMAVLINFSKTLIGILIDFSQVITLTFVNGFKQAAFGNLVKGMGIGKIMETVAEAPTGELLSTLGKVMMTLIFGIVIFTIISTVLLIMVIYFVVRIVMLWILLILSPIAFFALALPTKLQDKVKALTQDWWKHLGSFLTGGPIVAFFLWLALATVQGAAQPYEGIYRGEVEEPVGSVVISTIANTETLTTLIVTILLLLTGLKTAVSVSAEVSPKLGAIAGKLKAAGGPAGILGRYAGKGVSKVAKFGAKTKYGGKIGGLGSQLTGAAAQLKGQKGALGLLTRPMGALMQKGGTALGAVPGKAMALERAKLGEETKGQNAKDTRTILQGDIESGKNSGNQALENAARLELSRLAASPADFENLKNQGREDYYKKSGANRDDPAAKELAEAHATAQAQGVRGKNIEEGLKAAKATGDTAAIKELTDALHKDPSKYTDQKDIVKDFSAMISEPMRLLRECKPEAFQDMGVTTAYFQSAELLDASGRFKAGYKDSEAYQEFVKHPERKKYADALEYKMESDPGAIKALMNAGILGGDGGGARQRVSQTSDGRMIFASRTGDVAPQVGGVFKGGQVEIKNFPQLIAGLEPRLQASFKQALSSVGIEGDKKMNDVAMQFKGPLNNNQGEFLSKPENAKIYTNPPLTPIGPYQLTDEVEKYRQGLSLGLQPPPMARQRVYESSLDTALGQATDATVPLGERLDNAKAVANININAMEGSERNDMIASLAGKIDQLSAIYGMSKADPESMKKMEQLVKGIDSSAQTVAAKAEAVRTDADRLVLEVNEQVKRDKKLGNIGKRGGKKGRRG